MLDLQETLAARGFYSGPIDAVSTPQTQAALLIAYQRARRLPASGAFDQNTVTALGEPALGDFGDNRVRTIDMSSRSVHWVRALADGHLVLGRRNGLRLQVRASAGSAGFYTGPIDGVMDVETLAALNTCQRQEQAQLAGADDVDRGSLMLGVIPAQGAS